MDSIKKFIFKLQNKKKTIAIALLVVALLLIAAFATLAYLNSTTNTLDNKMTPTKLSAEIDEKVVNEYGEEQGGRTEATQNYKMVPGKTYTKDPILHIEAGSEPAYVYMTIDNPIEEYEAAENTIQYQMLTAGWLEYSGAGLPTDKQGKVYYKVDPVDARSYVYPATLNVSGFEYFILATEMDMPKDPLHVKITGYAIQSDGFNSATDAWDALYPKTEDEYKPLTDTIGETLVKYYPVFADNNPSAGETFAFSSDGKTYTEIDNPTIANLAESAEAGTLYYKGGTIQTVRSVNGISWDNTFKDNAPSYPYHASTEHDDLQEGIKARNDKDSEIVEKVVMETSGEPNATPTFNGVNLKDIWEAYNSEEMSSGFGAIRGFFWSNVVDSEGMLAYNWWCYDYEKSYWALDSFVDDVDNDYCVLISREFS